MQMNKDLHMCSLTPFHILRFKKSEEKRTMQEKQTVIDYIGSFYPFDRLPSFILEEIYRKTYAVKFEKGTVVKESNSITQQLYLIFSGYMGVFMEDVLIEKYGPGDMMCELYIDVKAPRYSTAKALTPICALAIGQNSY